MISNVTFEMFCERVQKFLANNWPDIANNVTTNEIMLYFFGEAGQVIEQDANSKYAIEGIYPDQEGFVTTYTFSCNTLTYDYDADEYLLSLPFPVVNLPLGYSIVSPYFVGGGGKSMPLFAIHGFQKGYDKLLPSPNIGVTYEVENQIMKIQSPDFDLINSGWTLRVPMKSPRSKTGADTDTINMPDAALEVVFGMVIEKLVGRKQLPQNNQNSGVDRTTETSKA